MRTYIFLSLCLLFLKPVCLNAQTDTTVTPQNVDTTILYPNDTLPNHTRDIGNEIPYLSVFNSTNSNVAIKLSKDKRTWSDFNLKSKATRLFRCDGVQILFIIVDPKGKYPGKALIYKNEKYSIQYNDQLNAFEIIPIKYTQ